MGVVYAATHEVTGKRVAIKMLHRSRGEEPGAASRVVREARAACAIEHPNVINVFDVGEDGGAPFIVMELLEGRTLGAVMAERARLSAGDAVELMMPVMRGVAAAHAAGVLHRDLKPDNAFVCIDGEGRLTNVKVLDFGVAKAAAPNVAPGVDTTTGAIVGTASYMSPEQVRGERSLDARADV